MAYVIHYHNKEIPPFVWDGDAESGLLLAADGLDCFEIRPMAHKSRRLCLRDIHGNLVAIAAKSVKRPF
jgi:hypothetical protein